MTPYSPFPILVNVKDRLIEVSERRFWRFWRRVDWQAPDCWPWLGHRNWKGYGQTSIGGIHVPAHRLAYVLTSGPIPAGLQLDHGCRVRHCCNPGHLEPVTARENCLRGFGRAAANARKTHCPQGHPLFGDNVQITYRGRRRCRACHSAYCRRWRERQVAA